MRAARAVHGLGAMKKGVFSSEGLGPADLGDSQKFNLWRDLYQANFGSRDFGRPEDKRFRAVFEFAHFGNIGLGAFEGTINYAGRTPHDVRADQRDGYFFLVNTGSPLLVRQRGREMTIGFSGAALVAFSEPAEFRSRSDNKWFSAVVPQQWLDVHVRNMDDLLARPLDPQNEALKHFRKYAKMLLGPNGIDDDPALNRHVGNSLLQLIALSLGANRDAIETTGMSGLRAARVRDIVAEIRSEFSDPSFSSARVAAKLRMSERYVQDLLTETGTNFTARVMEARLQEARMMLENQDHDRLAIAEIADRCGFNEISYFNRSFRRRFGRSPSDVRKRLPC